MRFPVAVLLLLCFLEANSVVTQDRVPTLRAYARTVVVDVTVTDREGRPVTGLQREDFNLNEKGVPQTITSFEEHSPAASVATVATAPLSLPLGVFTNAHTAPLPETANVLLLGSLNTPLGDQLIMRAQALDYLKTLPPNTSVAIFTLSGQLGFVQGFTSDPARLLAALRANKPHVSPLLQTRLQATAQAQSINQIQSLMTANSPASEGAAAAAMQSFLEQQKNFQVSQRIDSTLSSLQQLGRYLANVPGRKNLIWLSGSFPLTLFPDGGGFSGATDYERQYTEEVRKTANLLTDARVALYPIDVHGLQPDGLLGADVPPSQHNVPESQRQSASMLAEMTTRNAETSTMDELARNTGGQAFYNTNAIDTAMQRAISDGAYFYTLTYTPATTHTHGEYLPIRISMPHAHDHLAYRRGYYADNEKARLAREAAPPPNPLRPYMGIGMPAFDGLTYQMMLSPAAAGAVITPVQPPATVLAAGSTHYTVSFALSVHQLKLELLPNGNHKTALNLSLAAYSAAGLPVATEERVLALEIDPQLFAVYQRRGLQLEEGIDIPESGAILRTGLFDRATGKFGTLEAPIHPAAP